MTSAIKTYAFKTNAIKMPVILAATAFGASAVLAQTLPTGVGSTRSALTEQGFFGGTMTNGSGLKYALQGSVGLATNPANSTLYAEFAGIDPFTSSSSGIGALILPFGTISGRNYSRSTFIDNNIFAATESATKAMVELWNVPAAKSPAAARAQALT